MIQRLPVSSATLHVVATLIDGARQEPLDRRETLLHVEPVGLDQRGFLALDSAWDWQASPPRVGADLSDGSRIAER